MSKLTLPSIWLYSKNRPNNLNGKIIDLTVKRRPDQQSSNTTKPKRRLAVLRYILDDTNNRAK